MPRFRKLYSKREQDKSRGDSPVLYKYDSLPQPFRVQVCNILRLAMGTYEARDISGYLVDDSRSWEQMYNMFTDELGTWKLIDRTLRVDVECVAYPCQKSVTETLDAIDFFFGYVMTKTIHYGTHYSPKDAIDDLNARFKDHELGYQFLGDGLVRLDSEYLYIEAAEPAVGLLYEQGFDAPLKEFMSAHRHYLHAQHKECMNDAFNSFESTMKCILSELGIVYAAMDTAKPLLQKLLGPNGTLPSYLENSFNNLVALMEGEITMRNRETGHGQGTKTSELPAHYARYMLNVTATNIVFMVDAYKAKIESDKNVMPE